jgi:hypothetical protein
MLWIADFPSLGLQVSIADINGRQTAYLLRPIAEFYPGSYGKEVRATLLIWTMVTIPVLTGCQRREERVTILQASNLRHEIVPSTNEHIILLDVVMRREEWEDVSQKDVTLQYQNCQNRHRSAPSYYDYGIVSDNPAHLASQMTFGGSPATRITFNMLRTNVPAEADAVMISITCVKLTAPAGYGFVSYYSDPVNVAS